MNTYHRMKKSPRLCLLALILTAWGESSMHSKAEQRPEQVLNISLDFGSTDPTTITKDEAIARVNPVTQALVSGDKVRQQAALRLIDVGFTDFAKKDSSYMMLGSALLKWVGYASDVKSPKIDRDKFVATVNAVLELHGKEDPRLVASAVFMLLDLSLAPLNDRDADSLLRRWKATDTYKQLTAP